MNIPITMRPAADGSWWALNKRHTGWASFGYHYPDLGSALDAHAARATSFGVDKFGLYVNAERIAEVGPVTERCPS